MSQILAAAAAEDNQLCKLWTPTRLLGVLDRRRPIRYWGMENLAGAPIYSDDAKIRFDILYDDATMAPWVCPCETSPTGVVQQSFDSLEVEPGYLKLKAAINPCKMPKRFAGDTPWRLRNPKEQLAIWMVLTTEYLERSVALREEHMLWHMLRNAKYDIIVEDQLTNKRIAKSTVNFKRKECLNEICFDWSKEADCIFTDLRDAYRKVNCESGGTITDLIMGWEACDAFVDNKGVLERMKCTGADYKNPQLFDAELDFTPDPKFGNMQYQGRIGAVRIWCMQDFWICSKTKTKQYFVEPNEVIGIDRGNSDYSTGIRPMYGAIMDCDSMESIKRFMKSWKDPDAGLRYANIQSSPMIAMLNANATFRGVVKNTKKVQKAA